MNRATEDYIIDDQKAGLFKVNRRVFTDPECLEEERRRIFDKCWIYVGHESEVPHAGDYRSRNVAGRPMILVRGDDSVVRVLLNTCTHRGAMVCRQKSGNAKTFQCPYHAWTFNTRGQSGRRAGRGLLQRGVQARGHGAGCATSGGQLSRIRLRLLRSRRAKPLRLPGRCARVSRPGCRSIGSRNEDRRRPAILQCAC